MGVGARRRLAWFAAALAALESLPPFRRVVAASLTGLPYLGASFLAQSAFKETVMALFVLALAVSWNRRDVPARALVGVTVLFAAGSVFAFSLPGLAWLGLALPLWLAIAYATGDVEVDTAALRQSAREHRGWLIGGGVTVAIGAVAMRRRSGASRSRMTGTGANVMPAASTLPLRARTWTSRGAWGGTSRTTPRTCGTTPSGCPPGPSRARGCRSPAASASTVQAETWSYRADLSLIPGR